MKAVVIYKSQTGFTKRYAQWIAEALGADCLELPMAKKKDFGSYDAVIFGGCACVGRIRGIRWFKGMIDKWDGKKLIAFCVGASPIDSPEIELALKQNFTEMELKKVNVFYCPGGLDYEKMPKLSYFMMKMFVKSLQAKKDKTETEQNMIRFLSKSYDITDKKYVEPILECIRK